MSIKPDFAAMNATELRDYVLQHRGEEEALHVYLDRLHAKNPSSKTYSPEDNVTDAIAEFLKNKSRKNFNDEPPSR